MIMHKTRFNLCLFALAILFAPTVRASGTEAASAGAGPTVTIPVGTVLTVQMIDEIDSSKNRAGDQFDATVSSPVAIGERVVIPQGSNARVQLVAVKRAGRLKGRSELELELVSLTVNGVKYAVQTDHRDIQGASRGKRTAATMGGGAGLGALIGAIAGGGKGAAIGAGIGAAAGAGTQAATKGQQVKESSEAKIDFTLSAPLTLRLNNDQTPSASVGTYADFSAPTIQTSNASIVSEAAFGYNTTFGGSWRIVGPGGGFSGTFSVPTTGQYSLLVTHLTSYEASCPGGGYSPVTIQVNTATVAENYDPGANHSGSHGWVTDTWPINANAGQNTLRWVAGPLCTHYWIRRIEILPFAPQGPSTAERNRNLITNPGFEDQLDHWSVSQGSAAYTIDSAVHHSGADSVKGVEPSAGSLGRLYQDVTRVVVPGQQYILSGWIQTQNVFGGGGIVIALDYVTSGGSTPQDGYVAEIGHVIGTQSWTFFQSAPFTLAHMPSDAVALWVLTDFNAATGTAWFDDLQLTPAEAGRSMGDLHGKIEEGSPNRKTLAVSGNQPWTASGINVVLGEEVTVIASGGVSLSAGSSPVGPGGMPPSCLVVANGPYGWRAHPYLANELPCGSLVGRIGQGGRVFEIGNEATFRATVGGEFYLGTNDNVFGDNSGSWSVTIVTGAQTNIANGGEQQEHPASMSDDTVVSDINAKLWQDEALKTLDIRVSSQNGVVTIKGRVNTDLQKAAVERIAGAENGVRQVIDLLMVSPSPPSSTPAGKNQTQTSSGQQGEPSITITGGVVKGDIHSVDFRNFDYLAACDKPDEIIHATGGKSIQEGQYYFRIGNVVFGDLKGDGRQEAVVHTECSRMTNFAYNSVYVFAMSVDGGPILLDRLSPSDWGAGQEDNGGLFQISDVRVNKKLLAVSFYAGGSHAQPDWIVTSRFQWDGSHFVRIGLERKPFSGWPRK
jgi:hypothetical protein